jgi:hypothetical protein
MAAKKKAARRRATPLDGDSRKVVQSAASEDAKPTLETQKRRQRRMKAGNVGGLRDILTVHPKTKEFADEYVTRWFKDTDENGQTLLAAYERDWDYVTSDEVSIGENFVYNSGKRGSIVRVPAGKSTEDAKQYLYLMKKYKDWFEGDTKSKLAKVDQVEQYIARKRDPDKVEVEGEGYETEGLYGDAKHKWR